MFCTKCRKLQEGGNPNGKEYCKVCNTILIALDLEAYYQQVAIESQKEVVRKMNSCLDPE